ncbi:MAG: putative addiction module antidote protein [Acetobacteraceae bacterium]|nr:putative addiction module antidote protein [Acetobacteraceae bacterium]
MPAKTRPFDPATYLDNEEGIAAYLNEVLLSNDPGFIADALGVVARAALGMATVARDAGLSRGGLYWTLGQDGSLELCSNSDPKAYLA